jgi:hypothetical protein
MYDLYNDVSVNIDAIKLAIFRELKENSISLMYDKETQMAIVDLCTRVYNIDNYNVGIGNIVEAVSDNYEHIIDTEMTPKQILRKYL